jgi:hypothetical protein
MLVIDGGPPGNLTVADSRFPVLLSTFTLPRRDAFPIRDYTELGVPDERTRSIDANSEHYQALAFVGPGAAPQARSALRRIIASLAFRRPQVGTTVGEQTVLGSADAYPVGSFTLIHAGAEICSGSVRSCRAGRAPFYLAQAPGVLHQPDLINPCTPTVAACGPPGAFYAIGWRSEDILGGYRSSCDLRLDRRREQFYCTNSAARWDRVGRVIRRPAGARFGDPLQFAFAKIAWDGDVVMIAGMDGNPPRNPARHLLWPDRRDLTPVAATRGEDLPHAYRKLHTAGLRVTFNSSFSLNWSYECMPIIAGSVPSAGTHVRRGSVVSLIAPRSPICPAASPAVPVGTLPSYRVPDFIGKPLTTAIAWIQHRNLYWAATIPPLQAGDATSLFANYTITRQRPRPGGAMKLGNEGHHSFQPTPLSLTVNRRPPAGR